MNYIKQKRNQVDRCNICGRLTKLTWDHIPPKAVLNEPNTYANTLFSESELPSINKHMAHYQSGIKYRSICADCNNVVLGKNDIVYKEFIDEIVAQLETAENAIQQGIVVPRIITVSVKINRVLRAICGHILAMKTIYDDQTITDDYLRAYVKDESLRLEKENLFSWFYPYSTVVNVRDLTTRGHYPQTHPNGFISVMAAYPLAYMVSSNDEISCRVDNLGKYSTEGIEDKVAVTLHIDTALYAESNQVKHFAWPVNISDDEYGAMFALGNGEIMDGSRVGVVISKK